MSFLRPVFENALLDDDRTSIFNFEIPGYDGVFEVLPPTLDPWLQLGTVLVVNMMILALLAAAVHTLIIPRRGTSLAYLLGYGVVIPLSLALPFFLIEYLDVMGPFPKFGLFCIPTQTTFRCIEAMHGTSPPSVETSVAHYMTYYTCTMDFQWDPKTNRRVRITNAELARRNLELLWEFLCLSVVLSYLLHYDFKPFSSDMVVHHFGIGPELLSPHHVANTFLYAVATFYALALGFNGSAATFNAQGFYTYPAFLSPLWKSRSPTDFWSRRWNLVIHETLKRAVYKPFKKAGYSTWVGIFAAFVASGLLHDYCWTVMFYYNTKADTSSCYAGEEAGECFRPIFGKQTAFFAWCGVTMLLERPVGRLAPVRWMAKNLPLIVVSLLNVLTAVPLAHWYTGDWIQGGFLNAYSMGIFRIRYVN